MLRTLFILLALAASPAFAEPFTLSDPRIGASQYAPREVSLGGSAGGYLLTGLASYSPIAFPVSRDGDAAVGARPLRPQNASSVSEPVFFDDRWIVPVTHDFIEPPGVSLVEVTAAGEISSAQHALAWEGAARVSLASNGPRLLLAAMRNHDFLTSDLLVRTLSPDLATAGEEQLLASGVTDYRLAPLGTGFLAVYRGSNGLHALRLSAEGVAASAPLELTAAPAKGSIDIASSKGTALVAWSEGTAPSWSLRAVRIGESSVESLGELAQFSGDLLPRTFVRSISEGRVVIVWQGISYPDGNWRGGPIRWGILAGDNHWSTAPGDVPGLAGGEVLDGAAASGSEALLAWHRLNGVVGIPMWGAVVSESGIAPAKLLALGSIPAKLLAMAGSPDGSSWAAWSEMSGLGSSLWLGRWNRNGLRVAVHEVRRLEGWFDRIELANNGAQTILVWQEGAAIVGAYVSVDATLEGDPFLIASGGGPAVASAPGGFVVGWIGHGLEAAFISGTRVEPIGTIAMPPAPTPYSTFGILSARMAYGAGGGMAAVNVVESINCTGIPCQQIAHVGLVSFAGINPMPSVVPLISSGSGANVASDGKGFLAVWTSEIGLMARRIGAGGIANADFSLFARPNAGPAALAWDGTDYVAAWSYLRGTPSNVQSSIVLGRVSALAQPLPLLRGLPGRGTPLVAAIPGDALVGWIAPIALPDETVAAPVAEFERNAGTLPPPPPRPDVTLTRSGSILDILWNTVAGADSISVQIISHDPLNSRVMTIASPAGADQILLVEGDENILIRALNEGGGSEAVDLAIPPARRRAARSRR